MRDQDLLFSPANNVTAAQLSSDLDSVQNELSQAQQELQQERDLRVAQVAEVEGRHDALKREVAGMFFFRNCCFCPSILGCFGCEFSLLSSFVELKREKERWAKDLEDMKTTLRSSENKLSTVSALADSRVADANRALDLARQLRRDADRDIFQAVAFIQELEGRLDASTTRFWVL